jgi:protein TonB
MAVLYHSYVLPWTLVLEEVERLKKLVIVVVFSVVLFGLVIPFIPIQKPDRTKVEPLPPRLAQLVVEKKLKPKPPPVKKIKKKKKKKKPKKKKKKKKEKKKPKPKPKKTDAQKVAEARKKAQSVGLLAFADELSGLRDVKIKSTKKLSKGGSQAKQVTRNILTSNVSSGSGGIDTSRLSSGIGRTNLAGRETTKVKSKNYAQAANVQRRSNSGKPARTFEEVSLIFDKNKGSIYSLYNRELRKNPDIEGKVLFELKISPSGQVISIRIISSELNSPKFEKKLMARIKLFNFGAKSVDTLTVTYPIDFLPP